MSFTPLRMITHVIASLLTIVMLVGCGRTSEAGETSTSASNMPAANGPRKLPFTAVVTTAMIGDIVSNIAGDRATVRTLMGPGVDPHLYRPTRDDVSALLAADIVFYNGLNLEGKMADTFVKVARGGKPVFAVTELLGEEFLLSPPDFEGHDDPHVWMDPNGWIKAAEVVTVKLSEFDPAGASTYAANGERYIAQLRQLDAYAKQRLATIPAERRVLVTAHDAFNYFARAYGIEVMGIQGISTDSEAGLLKIESLVATLADRRIPAVFTETSVSAKNINALIEGAQSRGHEVRIGGELFSDAMGPAGTYEGTYLGMLDHNITTITRALGGEAPERGMTGKLSH